MMIKIGLAVVGALAVFLGYVSTRPEKFHYAVTMPINAPVEKVFPYLSEIKLGSEWSPYEKDDPGMKKEYVGNKLIFEGSGGSMAGSVEILKVNPNESVELQLLMTKPFATDNQVFYKIVPTATGSELTWSMTGNNNFLGKLMGTIIDCDKMMTEQFTKGINNLKAIVEK